MSRELLKQCLDLITDLDKEGLILESGLIFALRNELAKPEHTPWCDYLNIMLTSMPPQRAKCNCKIAESEQEPKLTDAGVDTNIPLWGLKPKGSGMVMLHQREWVGLTDDEINKIVDLNTSDDGGFDIWCDGIAVARIVCAKLKEKNA
jgi:hypothetical protein